jgi:phosphate transport system substrate-binding protein
MKKAFLIFVVINIILTYGCGNRSNRNGKDSKEDLKGTISISGSSAFYPLVQKWTEEFQKVYPNTRIDVSAGGDSKGMADALSGQVNIGMLSREISKEESGNGAWFIAVAKNAVLPIINPGNPVLQQLMLKGMKKETLKDIFIMGKVTNWSVASGKKKIDEKINVYKRSDACGEADIWAKYLGKNQEDLIGAAESGDDGLIQAVKSDKDGIGFTNIGYAYDLSSKYENTGIKVLPIDLNSNGILDDKEYFYQHKDSLQRAIKDGRFPKLLSPELYFVCKEKPTDKLAITFLKWVLSDGQRFISNAGYVALPDARLKAELDKME